MPAAKRQGRLPVYLLTFESKRRHFSTERQPKELAQAMTVTDRKILSFQSVPPSSRTVSTAAFSARSVNPSADALLIGCSMTAYW